LALSCGGSGGSGGSAGMPDASGGPADGGAQGPDGGLADAGNGGGQPDAGNGGGQSDAGSGGGQSDAGTDGGVAPDACRSLMPAQPGNPIVYRTDPLPAYERGEPGTTDGRGEVLVPIVARFDSPFLSIFDSSGMLLSNPPAVGGSSFATNA